MESRRVSVLSVVVLLAGTPLAYAQSPVAALSEAQEAVACAPALLAPAVKTTRRARKDKEAEAAANTLRILGGQDTRPHTEFGPGELVVVSGGLQAGVQLGQEYFVRRNYKFGTYTAERPRSAMTAGWLRVVAVNDSTAIAIVDNVCEAIAVGDYLEPFTAPAAPALATVGDTPANLDFTALGRVLFGSSERRLAGVGEFMIIDRGSAEIAPGTRVAVYRDLTASGVPLAAIGEGVVVANANGAPVMEITAARDAIQSGDYIVPRK